MKTILILAEGVVAEEFVSKINSKRVTDNKYTIVKSGKLKLPDRVKNQIELIEIDPTSYSKMRRVFIQHDFSMVFIVLERVEDVRESLKIIRRIDKRIRVVLLDMWGAFDRVKRGVTLVFNAKEMLSNQLYNSLPNVPTVARNVGLGEGEVMEVLIPFGSTFAYRHIGSIAQIRWRIVALYRNSKLIMPNTATVIRPQDTLLIVGRPQVLINIFRKINNRSGMFPEPFGRNLYLILDMSKDNDMAEEYIKEAILILEKLEKSRELIIKVINPINFETLDRIKDYRSRKVEIFIIYIDMDMSSVMAVDIEMYDIGLIFLSRESFKSRQIYKEVYEQKKMIYLFGKRRLRDVKKSIITITQEKEMESISSIGFYISETLNLKFALCDFDPEGDFNSKKRIKEHYETLSHIFQYPVKVEQKQVNPVRELKGMESVLYVAPFNNNLIRKWFHIPLFSTNIKRYLVDHIPHPKLLVPIEV